MAYQKMKPAPINEGVQNEFSYEYEGVLSSVAAGDWILIPDGIYWGVSVTVSFTDSAQGKVQTTTDTINKIIANTAIPVDWPLGTVSANTSDGLISPVSAIRANQTSVGGGAGTMTITMRAQ